MVAFITFFHPALIMQDFIYPGWSKKQHAVTQQPPSSLLLTDTAPLTSWGPGTHNGTLGRYCTEGSNILPQTEPQGIIRAAVEFLSLKVFWLENGNSLKKETFSELEGKVSRVKEGQTLE